MGILDGKRILVTGVLTDQSIAYHVARLAQEQGATVVLTSFGRALNLTRRTAGRLPSPAPVIELDVTSADDLAGLEARVREHVDGLDGVLHSIGFAPEAALGGNFLNTEWPDVATAVQISAYSLKSLTMAALPLMPGSGSCGRCGGRASSHLRRHQARSSCIILSRMPSRRPRSAIRTRSLGKARRMASKIAQPARTRSARSRPIQALAARAA